MSWRLGKEVAVINDGLNQLGENHLNHRIRAHFYQSGLSDIAGSINHMAQRLEDNINRAYYFELKKREARIAKYTDKYKNTVVLALQMFVSAGSAGYGWDEFDPE